MVQPWERPSLVLEGDQHPDQTHLAVGHVLSGWEGVEIQLGYMYASAVGKRDDCWTLLEYGESSAFRGRFRVLEEALGKLFIKRPNQEVEGRVMPFVTKADNFSRRRNEVAHGIVRNHQWARWRIPPNPDDPTGWFLLPAHYAGRAYDDSTALPIYAYTAKSLGNLRHQLTLLETEAMGIANLLDRHLNG
jgi:hypothetical protein